MSALVPYKKVHIAIEACRLAGAPLRIVGTGPELARLRRMAGPDVEFLGWLPDEEIRALYQQARAVLLPGIEDFGIVPVEAQACGCPVIATAAGGATETVVHGETGLLVAEASADGFAEAIARAGRIDFEAAALRQHSLRFSGKRFMTDFEAAVADAVAAHAADRRAAV